MSATAEATAHYASRFSYPNFFRDALGVTVSSLGIGTYLGQPDEATDRAYTDAVLAAAEGGINLIDTAINYRHTRSERSIGAALRQLRRPEFVVCTKAGFLTPGAVPASLTKEDVVGGMHSMAPHFLADQIARSLDHLGIATIDVFYLHNPETQLGFLTREAFDDRLRRAFEELERQVSAGTIRNYGAATWEGFRKKGALDLARMAAIAQEVAGDAHHFRCIQLPFNLGMVEAYVDRPESALEVAARHGIAVIASATLMQARTIEHMPDAVAELLPGLDTAAQRAIQFTRSTPGITAALVGMSNPAHVRENLGVARVAPATREQYQRLYQ